MSASSRAICPICGGSEWRTILDGASFRIEECSRGCIGRTVPPPEYSPELPEGAKAENLIAADRDKSGHFTIADRILDLVRGFQPCGRLLDIGCGWGQLLRAASDRGYDAVGIEASPGVAEIAREAFGVECVVGAFPVQTFEPDSFDIVVMNHVLEHVDDPHSVIEEAGRLLKPGGVLAICVPNFGGLMRSVKGVQWQGLQPTQHVWQLTEKSVRALIEQSGLVPALVSRDSLIYERGAGSLPKWLALRMVLASAKVLRMGDNLIAIGRKG